MSDYADQLKASRFIETLKQQNMVEDESTLVSAVVKQAQAEKTSVFIHILIAFGTLLTTVFFLLFLYAAQILDFQTHARSVFMGILFIASAIGLLKISDQKTGTLKSYTLQLAFALMALGKILVVIGVAGETENLWHIPLTLLVLTVPIYFLFPLSLDRYLSVTAVLISTLVAIMLEKNLKDEIIYVFNGLLFVQIIISAVLISQPYQRLLQPLLYAFMTGLFCMIIYLATQSMLLQELPTGFIPFSWTSFILAGSLMALICYTTRTMDSIPYEPLLISAVGVLALGIVSAPGVIFSISLMILGYMRHDRILLTFGVLLMPAFLIQYYYNLHISLLHKSGILIASGLLLLIGYAYIHFRGWNRGEDK